MLLSAANAQTAGCGFKKVMVTEKITKPRQYFVALMEHAVESCRMKQRNPYQLNGESERDCI